VIDTAELATQFVDEPCMRHHFGDLLDRDGGYWTTLPNRERHAYRIGDVPAGSKEVTIVTIGKDEENWSRALTLPNLEELTLHAPTREQLGAIGELDSLKRLRITHAHPRTIEFIQSMAAVEELVLEYVSGFSDLSPLQGLKRLRALHLENLRRVANFGGLSGVDSLKYLAIYGTLDWKQPIEDFEFLRGLESLEVLAFWEIMTKKAYPATLPALGLKNLKKLRLPGSYLPVQEYALLEEGLKDVEGATWQPYKTHADRRIELDPSDIRAHLPVEVIQTKHPEVMMDYTGKRTIDDPASLWFEFTGKGERRVKCGTAKSEARCRDHAERYQELKQAARALIDQEQFT
jgi:hypothetical protein